jgi:hypothetical protein
MRKGIIIIASMILASCNNDAGEIGARNDSPVVIAPEPKTSDSVEISKDVSGCYRKILGRDTMFVQLQQTGTSITGNMFFDNFEKDASRGTVKGIAEGSIIKLWYDFQSEGMNSVMEMWFLHKENSIIRGVGSFGVKGDTSYYTNPADIKYEEGQGFDKIKCPASK